MRLPLPRFIVHVAVKLIPYMFFVLGFLYIFTWYWEIIKYEEVEQFHVFRNTAEEAEWAETNPSAANKPLDAVWQPVGGTRFRFYVYSAYVERRNISAVRIIAASRTIGTDAVYCQIWLPSNRTFTLKTKIEIIHGNDGLKYSAMFVLCLLDANNLKPQDTIGATVSVFAQHSINKPPTNMLTVIDTEPKSGTEERVHICVKPLHRFYSDTKWLIEWLEFNRLLGATHFYMYEESLKTPVACILEHYRTKGVVSLLSWNLPIASLNVIRHQGLFAAFNDCLYRSMSNAGWLLVIDVYEIVVPRREHTLPVLLSSLRMKYNTRSKAPAAYLFRNAYFYLKWEDDSKAEQDLIVARKTRRTYEPLKNRGRVIVRPRNVTELGNYFVWKFVDDEFSANVPINSALLHRYQAKCDFNNANCLAVPAMVDRSAHEWTEELIQRVHAEKKHLSIACSI